MGPPFPWPSKTLHAAGTAPWKSEAPSSVHAFVHDCERIAFWSRRAYWLAMLL